MSRIESRLARLEVLSAPAADDLRSWSRRPILEMPDWVLLSIATGRRFTAEEAEAMQDCPELDQELAAYLANARAGARGAEAAPSAFRRSLEWLRNREVERSPR